MAKLDQPRVGSARLTVNRLKRSRPTPPNRRGRRRGRARAASGPSGDCYSRYGHERIPPCRRTPTRGSSRWCTRASHLGHTVRHGQHHPAPPIPTWGSLRVSGGRPGRGCPAVRPGPIRRSGGPGRPPRAPRVATARVRLPAATAPRRRRAALDRGDRPGAARADARHPRRSTRCCATSASAASSKKRRATSTSSCSRPRRWPSSARPSPASRTS